MKKQIKTPAIAIFAIGLLVRCGGGNTQKEENTDAKLTENKSPENTSGEVKTIVAKYISAQAYEGEVNLNFKMEDGKKITLHRNNMDQNAPKLKVQFLGDDGFSENKSLIGSLFTITYKYDPNAANNVDGKESVVGCNEILSAKKK